MREHRPTRNLELAPPVVHRDDQCRTNQVHFLPADEVTRISLTDQPALVTPTCVIWRGVNV